MKKKIDNIKTTLASNSSVGIKNEDSAVTFDTSANNGTSSKTKTKSEPYSYIKNILNKEQLDEFMSIQE